MYYALLYIINIVAVNCAFAYSPIYILPGGAAWTPVALLVGFTFVMRDYAQRALGHMVLPAMLLGGAVSMGMASPEIALASVLAFLSSELMDWGIYSFSGKPFSQRILLSSLISTPLDSLVFLGLIGMLSLPTLLSMTLSKMLGATIMFVAAKRKENAGRRAPGPGNAVSSGTTPVRPGR
jgi:uncharacterized PurR-regulated membrane protein YhhQ (DUF165 family)